jgi:A118 family predicted phage portal protein
VVNIRRALKELGFDTVDSKFYSLIDVWKSWYDGEVKDFHSYTVWNGIEELECHRYSVNMGKKVCEDWANLLMNERVNITLEGKKEQEFVDTILANNNWEVKASESQERKAAVGTIAYVPIVEEMGVDPDTAEVKDTGKIHINYVTAANIYPLTWDNGIIRECAFVSRKRVDDREYTYIQVHRLNGGEYDIENHLYDADEVPLTSVRGFETIPPVVHTGSDKPQFVIDRLNIANSDEENPMGVAVFAYAIDQLKSIDITYDSYVNEFVLGKKRIVVQPEATKDINGRPVFDKRETVYYVLPEDRAADGNILQQVDMTLRTAEFNTGMQDMLNVLSSKCGFGENHYKFDQTSIATATQVISENSTMFNTIRKHEIILREAITNLCRTLLRMGNRYMGAELDENIEISIDFDDSIIEDKQADFNRDKIMLDSGIMNDWEFRMRWMNEDEATAKAALPKMQDMTKEPEEEIE